MKPKLKNQIIKEIYYEKNRVKLLQKQNNRYIKHKETLRPYFELENLLKALEEKFRIKDSEIN